MKSATGRSFFVLIVLVLAGLGLSGCVGLAVGAGATVGVAASEERGIRAAANDTAIRVEINNYWLQHNVDMMQKVSLQVHEGRVLLTGVVSSSQYRSDAARLAGQAAGVVEVINEIEVADGGGVSEFAQDTWISTQLKARMLFDERVQSINYSVETVRGIVYLLGVAQSQAELDRVTDIARNLSYVRRVVSHVRLKDDPSRPRA